MEDAEIALASANQLFGQAELRVGGAVPRRPGPRASAPGSARSTTSAPPRRRAPRSTAGPPSRPTTGSPRSSRRARSTTLTRLVLVNALYFKAPWATPFEVDATTDEEFHLGRRVDVPVPMMHGSRATARATAGAPPTSRYAGGTLAMTVVLPDEGREADLDAVVAGGGLGDVLAAAARRGRPVPAALDVPGQCAAQGRRSSASA